jgi:hypothetical protein
MDSTQGQTTGRPPSLQQAITAEGGTGMRHGTLEPLGAALN